MNKKELNADDFNKFNSNNRVRTRRFVNRGWGNFNNFEEKEMRKILALFCMVSLFCMSAIPAFACVEADTSPAGEAQRILSKNFPIIDGHWHLPDDYAGSWIEGENLHIALTTTEPEAIARYKELLPGFEDIIIFEWLAYPLNKLLELQEIAGITLREQEILYWGITVYSNINKVGIDFSDSFLESAVRNILIEATDGLLTREEVYTVFVLRDRNDLSRFYEENPRTGITPAFSLFLTASAIIIISRKRK
jgi:hypothetical protein